MQWRSTLRLVTVAAAMAALGLSATAVSSLAPPQPHPTVETRTISGSFGAELEPNHEELVDWARTRFEDAGLELPEVDIQFHSNIMVCNGRVGIYHANSDLIVMCRVDKMSMLHELAHVWARSGLTDGDRSKFVALRGLSTWNDHSLAWAQRGTEHAAEIVTWALMDRNMLIPSTIANAGASQRTWRLPTIGNSDPDQLAAAYELLTGYIPADRLEDDPRLVPHVEALSPEVRDLLAP